MAYVLNTKPFFERLFRPWARVLAARGVTANQVTVTSMVLSFAAGAAVLARPEARWPLLLIPGVLLVRLAFDHIDGLLARRHGMESPLGCILNEHLNVVADAALYLPLATVPGVSPWLVVAVVLTGVIGEMTGVVAVQIGADRRIDGPVTKKTRAVVFGTLALTLFLGAAPAPWPDVVLAAMVPLSVLTIVNRAYKALRQVS